MYTDFMCSWRTTILWTGCGELGLPGLGRPCGLGSLLTVVKAYAPALGSGQNANELQWDTQLSSLGRR